MELANTLSQDGESRGGVLAHLERLETQVSRSRKKMEEPQSAQAEESALGTRIHELRRLRDKLRAEVKQHQASVKASTTNVEPDQTLEITEQESLKRKWENVKAILQAYRFTGISGKLTSRGVCVCISTAFEGNLLDSYFVDLVMRKPLQIHHHSIPVFIPLEEISAKYLQTNIQHFLFTLCEYLNAYSGRKYQADRLQSDFEAFLAGPLQRNSLCNLLSFTYKAEPEGQSFPFCARLLYKDLTTTLPTDVTVTYQGTDALSTTQEEQRAAHENLFFTKPLHQVFTSFARKGDKLDMSLVS
ncbi:centromere protein O isoform X1 [Orcinus orca]|uniref:Centromere protein O n=1 Tax=Tursiops truncatus TaxID=9739 RepID=A0A6J3PXP0_TURTR|nr:centromere protein O isoform X1 [Orcinus orca]XP_030714104.1 centromere protein O [Globicephala melas]XP_030714105.1 centromere protein O [Globicephala melas]XP_030714106.1 centromere protein O [Globicephala melas]XP_030714107.1 centromere protein O isoform X1 [Globicephala melas]XP_033280943.1 centromere protein O isoform X1 [Orcinus orca]XP_033280944.1 centromere protein O isoform X1 [Orcinus orca]XP_033694826.1 centromere protein O isoform X1 [Tursiops truncatus]XP_033694827.1 centrom